MTIQQLDDSALFQSDSGSRFLLLGERPRNPALRDLLDRKLRRETTVPVPGVWGTLGGADNSEAPAWRGRLEHSARGHDDSSGIVLEEVRSLYGIHDVLDGDNAKVVERYINFDQVKFEDFPETFTSEDMPRIRLTLFLQHDEGAVVAYQHFTGRWQREGYSDLEYILPQPNDADHSLRRDRLDFIFPVLPSRKIEADGDDTFRLGEPLDTSFVVKILTFRRDSADNHPDAIVERACRASGLDTDHRLLRFDPESNQFRPPDAGSGPRSSRRTLLLLHGTFSSTEGSFAGLMENGGESGSWLQQASLRYEQILGFDHPTIRTGIEDNLAAFLHQARSLDFRRAPLDLITFSRGGLLGRHLVTSPDTARFPVHRAALVSAANGVGYFHRGQRFLGMFFRYMRRASGPAGRLVTAFAQLSADYFFRLPGPTIMNENSEELAALLDRKPADWNADLAVRAFTGRWNRRVHADSNLARRLAMRGIHTLTIPFLGRQSDLVVNQDNQSRMPEARRVEPPARYLSTHTTFFQGPRVAESIKEDLHEFLNPDE